MQNINHQNEQTATPIRRDIHQQVTDTIIRQLEAGTVPWHRPWKGESNRLLSLPVNFHSGNQYRGVNILLLWSAAIEQEYKSSEWASYRQWAQQGEAVNKGEKGTMIVYYDTFEKEVDGEIQKIPFIKSSVVFNRCQLAGYVPFKEAPNTYELSQVNGMPAVDRFVENTMAVIAHQGSEACYSRVNDTIYMPDREKFIDTPNCSATAGYYATLMHELVHWTGADKRIGRIKGKRFGDENYAAEELVAELGAAFLCAEFDITTPDKKNHASYIANWLQVLRNDKKFIFSAASEASKAVQLLNVLQH